MRCNAQVPPEYDNNRRSPCSSCAIQADLAAILLKLEDPDVGYSRQDEAMRVFKELDAAILRQPPNELNVKRCNIIMAAQKLPQGVNTALRGCCSCFHLHFMHEGYDTLAISLAFVLHSLCGTF